MRKKIQVFVSSTYTDLLTERQAAVQAILDAGHIPAGMELFRAGNDSQLDTVKRWIKDSDAYLLILGGRYGSIESISMKSYTHVEYEYALSLGIPVFSLVLSDAFLHIKAANANGVDIYESTHKVDYKKFKDLVMSKIVRVVNDEKEIQLEIFRTIPSLMEDYDLSGWVKGIDTHEFDKIKEEKTKLLEENSKLLTKLQALEAKIKKSSQSNKDQIGDYSFDELKEILSSHMIDVPAEITSDKKKCTTDVYSLFMRMYSSFATGIEDRYGMSSRKQFLFFKLAPTLLSYGLLERVKLPKSIVRIQTSNLGSKFYGRAMAINKTAEQK